MKQLWHFMHDLTDHIYCRLQPSRIHGVGVFAIRDIPEGIDPLHEYREVEFTNLCASDINGMKGIPDSVKKLVKDMCPENNGFYEVPSFSLNEIGLSYYLNHSNCPNMEERDGYFLTMRKIEAGEELTVDYGTYGELNLG